MSPRYARAIDACAIAWLLACLGAVLWLAPTAPVTWDERAHALYGDAILRWFTDGDPQALAFRGDSFYGGGFDLLGALVRRGADDPYVALHRLGGVVAWLGGVAMWRVARRLGPAVGLLALVLLTLTPVYVGHAFANPKDLPLAAGYAAGLLGVVRWFEAPERGRGRVASVGLLLGLAACVRVSGLFLLGVLVVGELVALRRRAPDRAELLREADRVVPSLVCVVALAWAVMLVPWPWALQNPVVRPLLSLANLVDFQAHDRLMPFAGESMRTLEPRRDYAFHYLAFKLPLPILAGLMLAAVTSWRAPQPTLRVVWAAALVPLLLVLLLNPVLYDGMRHVLFVVPPLCVLAAWGIVAAVRRWAKPWPLLVIAGGLGMGWAAVTQARALVSMHPMQAVWFNPLVGGLSGAQGRYSLDYYGFTYRECATKLRAYVKADPSLRDVPRIPIAAAMPQWAATWTFGAPFEPTRGPSMNEPAPIFHVAYTRGDAHLEYPRAATVATVERDGVVLAVVKDLRRRGHGG